MDLKLILLLASQFLLACSRKESSGATSFLRFRGPVSGQIRQVSVPHVHRNEPSVDYVAKPDYVYAYGVEDPETGNTQSHLEARDGDTVAGEYKLLQADGVVRIVEYLADGANGFKATVRYETA